MYLNLFRGYIGWAHMYAHHAYGWCGCAFGHVEWMCISPCQTLLLIQLCQMDVHLVIWMRSVIVPLHIQMQYMIFAVACSNTIHDCMAAHSNMICDCMVTHSIVTNRMQSVLV